MYFLPSKFCFYYFLTSFHFAFGFVPFEKSLYYEFNRASEGGKSKCMCLIFCYPLVFVYITQKKLLISVLDDPGTRMRRGERSGSLLEAASCTYLNLLFLGMVDRTLVSTASLPL